MKIHQLSIAAALESLKTSSDGLTEPEAGRRRQEYGPNRVAEMHRRHPVAMLLREFAGFFSVVLWIAAGLAFLLEREGPGEGMARLGYTVVGTILISGFFSFWQEFRAEKTLAALLRLLPTQVEVTRASHERLLPADQLVPGDIIRLREGDQVPADCRLIEALGAKANMATVTGESLPRLCETAPSGEESQLRAANVLLAGTSLTSGKVRAVVFATGMQTEFGSISRLAQASGEPLSPLRHQVNHLSRRIIELAIGIALTFFLSAWAIGIPLSQSFLFAIGIIIAMVPEGLLPTLTLALVLASKRMATRQVLIRHLPAVEALGSTTVICTDKTGTLTQNRMRVRGLYLGGRYLAPSEAANDRLLNGTYRAFFEIAAYCHDLPDEQPGDSAEWARGDPMEVALVNMAQEVLGGLPARRRLDELPFDTARMRFSTLHAAEQGAVLYCKGAPETVLPLCTDALVGGRTVPIDDALHEQLLRAQTDMAARGLRVLALAYRLCAGERPIHLASAESRLIFAGLAGLEDPPRPEVAEAIQKCHQAGIKVIMVTGDHPATALAIGRDIGLIRGATPVEVTGEQLRRWSGTQLQLALDAPEIIFSRVGADQKTAIVDALKRKREIVAVTGDGVNDAPALKAAHVGVAMGKSGTAVAREAADIVLLDDNFASIVAAIEEGRAVFDNIRKFLTYILAHNVPELLPYLCLALLGIPLALTPIQILAIDMGTDSLTALGLGMEKADPRTMQRPPRKPAERLLDWRLVTRAYFFLGIIEAVAAMATFLFVLHGGGWHFGDPRAPDEMLYRQATTACLVAIVLMQIVNVFLCRSTDRSILATGLSGNPLIAWGIAFELGLILIIVYWSPANQFFGTLPIGMGAWLAVGPFAAGILVLEELRKWLVRGFLTPDREITIDRAPHAPT